MDIGIANRSVLPLVEKVSGEPSADLLSLLED